MESTGKRQLDMLHGPIWNKIPRFALPIAATAILYRYLRHTEKAVHVEPKQLRIDKGSMKRILRIGLPAGAQSAVFSVANIIIQGVINSLGTVVMAASGAAFNIEIITYDILNSFSQACTTFVGQNYGAGEIKRCKRTPALLTMAGVCGIRLSWIYFVFPKAPAFQTIMTVFPISLAATALLMLIAVLCYRPSRRFAPARKEEPEEVHEIGQ